ncbi:unnamed protein product [Amoebophrya sp. A25]|nr:unnamed protein product [Amoebophrya sp. A25]|eukprot:GSA25T00016285001.1
MKNFSEDPNYFLKPPVGDTYEWGYPCSVDKLPLGAPLNQRFMPNTGGLDWGSYPNMYPTQCGTTLVKLDSEATSNSDFNGALEYVWMPDKAVNCMAVPAPHDFLAREKSRFGGMSAQWFRDRRMRGVKEQLGGKIMGSSLLNTPYKAFASKGRTDNPLFAFAGVQDGPGKRPTLRIRKGGFGNDIVWRDQPSTWSRLKGLAGMPLKTLQNLFTNADKKLDGKEWWPGIQNKYMAAFMCQNMKDCAYFVFDENKNRMQMCMGQELKPQEEAAAAAAGGGEDTAAATPGNNMAKPHRGRVFGFHMAKKMRGYAIGVSPQFLKESLRLAEEDKLIPNTKAVCPGRDGRYLETRPFAEDLRDAFLRNATSSDVLRPTHWWYNLAGSQTFYRQDSDVKGELCAGEPTLVPQTGSYAVLPATPQAAPGVAPPGVLA